VSLKQIPSLQEVYNFTAEDLKKVDALIKSSLSYRDQSIDMIANYVISSGGKRMRPLFVILSAKLFDYRQEHHIKIAAAIEFIHTATLLHDDIIDESSMRRGKVTANEKWGNKYAILVGDFLFSQAFKLMVDTQSVAVLDILSQSSIVIAEGEIKQLNNLRNLEITEENYIEVISAKTAELFGAACKSGAAIAKQSESIQEKLYQFGTSVGIAFQIIDDILDYTSNVSGKDIGNDYKEGKVTLPIIIALHYADDYEKKFIEKLFKNLDQQEEDFVKLLSIINKYGCFDKAKERAISFLKRAENILAAVAKSEEMSNLFQAIIEYQADRLS